MMSRIVRASSRWGQLNWSRRYLLLRAAILVSATELTLRLATVRAARRICRFLTRGISEEAVESLTWAAGCAGRWIPSRCLAQAITLQALLSKSGHRSVVEIGVDNQGKQLEAHAWVRYQGDVVLGGPDTSKFVSLAVLE